MRAIFLLILIAGLGAGFGYPWWVTNFSGRELGTWRVYDRGGSFTPVTVKLGADDAPVRVLVDMTAVAPPEFAPRRTVLTLTASSEGRTVLAQTLSFSETKPQERNPQLREKLYRDEAGVISDIDGGDYTFILGRGDVEGVQMRSVDLILRAGAGGVDPRIPPVGYGLAVIGFIGLVLSLRRKRAERNPNSQPPPPRWGRGSDRGSSGS